jgi:hypothetical protein
MRRNSRLRCGSLVSLLLAAVGCAEAGAPGRDGVDGAFAESLLSCSALSGDFLFEYQVADYSNGDVWTSCSMSDLYVEAGESSFWLAGQNGAVIAACAVTADWSGDPTGGWWLFTYDGAEARAVYDDSGDVNDGLTVTFLASECVLVER